MSKPRLYVPEILVAGRDIVLGGQQAHYLSHVLRMHCGNILRIFDGKGHEHNAVLSDMGRGTITLKIGATIEINRESTLHILLAQGITRNDRMDLILQKAVELGVQAIQPLWLQRSQSHLKGERLANRLQHWYGIIISACEQCGRNFLPDLMQPARFTDWIAGLPPSTTRLMLQPEGSKTLTRLDRPQSGIVLLAGPEGGLSDEEQSSAAAAGFTAIRLGPRILRTETAALAAVAGMQALWGDFSDQAVLATCSSSSDCR